MASILLRLGLWVTLIAIAVYVLHETYVDSSLVEYFSSTLIARVLIVGGALIVVGLVARLFEKTTSKGGRNRCVVCKTPISSGAIYCRAHLRRVLHSEEDRTH